MKKILVNAYLDVNFGDDLFLKILFDRYSNVEWILNSGDRRYKKIFKEYENVTLIDNIINKVLRKLRLNNLIKIDYKKYDAGVMIGGSMFMQNPTWKIDYERLRGLIYSFKQEDKPYFILGSNFGPYNDNKYKELYEQLYEECKDVCFRDNYSYNIFKELKNIRMKPDIVFQLDVEKKEKLPNTIGISIISLDERRELNIYKQNYYKKIKDIIEYAVQNQKIITLFSFCQSQGDLNAINNVLELLNDNIKKAVKVVNYDGNIEYFLEKFGEMENIIGTRFHACILSQVFNQGLYSIIYSDKTYNVLKDIGLENECMYIKDIEKLDVKNVLENIYKNKINSKPISKEAEKQFEILDEYVRS